MSKKISMVLKDKLYKLIYAEKNRFIQKGLMVTSIDIVNVSVDLFLGQHEDIRDELINRILKDKK